MLTKILIAGTAIAAMTTSSMALGFSETGAEKLQRLLKPHHHRIVVTQKVRDATGDPDIVVFDYRGGTNSNVYRCSYLTYRGKRAMVCD